MKKSVKTYRFKNSYKNPVIHINGVGRVTPENINEPRILEAMLSREFFAKMLEPVSPFLSEQIKADEQTPEAQAETPGEPAEIIEETEKAPEATEETDTEIEISSIPYISKLKGAGFDTVEKIKLASDEELEAIKGISAVSIGKIRKALV